MAKLCGRIMNPFLYTRENEAQRGKATCPRLHSWSSSSGLDSISDCKACFLPRAFIIKLAEEFLSGWRGQQKMQCLDVVQKTGADLIHRE